MTTNQVNKLAKLIIKLDTYKDSETQTKLVLEQMIDVVLNNEEK